jgi:hypothetical protein
VIYLSGNFGRALAGHQVAATFASWSLVRKDQTLGANEATGRATTGVVDRFWSTYVITCIELRLGALWWIWDDVTIQIPPEGGQVEFFVRGNPRIVQRENSR